MLLKTKPKVKLAVFDFDGVIIDSTKPLFFVFEGLGKELRDIGVKFPSEKFLRNNWGSPGENFIKKNFAEGLADIIWKIILFMESLLKKNPVYCFDFRVVEEMRAKGVKTAILTNRDHKSIEKHICGSDFLKKNFDIIVGYRGKTPANRLPNFKSCKKPKPSAESFEPILRFAKKHGIQKEEILFVGDALTDFLAAKNSGIPFAGVMTGAINTKELWLATGLDENNIFSCAQAAYIYLIKD